VLTGPTYRTPQSIVDFFNRLIRQLSEQSGVQGVAAMTGLPPVRQVNANDTDFEGYTAPPEGPAENVDYYQTVTRDDLKTMGITLLEGRDFAPPDVASDPVVLVNETPLPL
jgi:putative ABC transport system permease protein